MNLIFEVADFVCSLDINCMPLTFVNTLSIIIINTNLTRRIYLFL